MNTITAHPNTVDKAEALKAFLQALKINFEIQDNYNPEFVRQIKQGKRDIKNGKGVVVNLKDLKHVCS